MSWKRGALSRIVAAQGSLLVAHSLRLGLAFAIAIVDGLRRESPSPNLEWLACQRWRR